MDDSEKEQKEKKEQLDMEVRARMTFAATTDIDDSDKVRVSNEENVTIEQMKDYLGDVLEEVKGRKDKPSKA